MIKRQNVYCIVCKGALYNIDPEGNQPGNGLAFTSTGHYGSTVFDPMDGSFLEINVCDACLTTAQERGHVLLGMITKGPPHPEYETWRIYEKDTP